MSTPYSRQHTGQPSFSTPAISNYSYRLSSLSEGTRKQLGLRQPGVHPDEALEGCVLGPQSLEVVLHLLEVWERDDHQDLSRASHLQIWEVGVLWGRVLAVAHDDRAGLLVHLVLYYSWVGLI